MTLIRTFLPIILGGTINPGKDADAAVDSVKEETEDSKEAECPEEKES